MSQQEDFKPKVHAWLCTHIAALGWQNKKISYLWLLVGHNLYFGTKDAHIILYSIANSCKKSNRTWDLNILRRGYCQFWAVSVSSESGVLSVDQSGYGSGENGIHIHFLTVM